MPYKYVRHKNGVLERIPYNLTAAEELEDMTRRSGCVGFTSVNYRSAAIAKEKELLEQNQPEQPLKPKQP